jgi:protein-disulfide isomerase
VLVLGSGLFAVLFSAFLAWQSSRLGAWCLFCIGLYGVSILLLVAGFMGARDHGYLDHMREVLLGQGDRSSGSALTTAVLLLLTGGVYAETHSSADHAAEQQEEHGIDALYAQTQGPMVLTGKEPMYGRPSAPYTLVEFTDYGCPHCAALSAPIKKLVLRHPNLKLIHKHFVLSEASELLARAASCAHAQGRFWEMHDILFTNMGALAREDVDFIATRQLGLDADSFSSCLEDPATQAALETDGNAGQTVGIHGTPSLFLGGVVPGADWVQVVNGLDDAVELIVAAAERGDAMPAASPPKPHDHDH